MKLSELGAMGTGTIKLPSGVVVTVRALTDREQKEAIACIDPPRTPMVRAPGQGSLGTAVMADEEAPGHREAVRDWNATVNAAVAVIAIGLDHDDGSPWWDRTLNPFALSDAEKRARRVRLQGGAMDLRHKLSGETIAAIVRKATELGDPEALANAASKSGGGGPGGADGRPDAPGA